MQAGQLVSVPGPDFPGRNDLFADGPVFSLPALPELLLLERSIALGQPAIQSFPRE